MNYLRWIDSIGISMMHKSNSSLSLNKCIEIDKNKRKTEINLENEYFRLLYKHSFNWMFYNFVDIILNTYFKKVASSDIYQVMWQFQQDIER